MESNRIVPQCYQSICQIVTKFPIFPTFPLDHSIDLIVILIITLLIISFRPVPFVQFHYQKKREEINKLLFGQVSSNTKNFHET